MREVLVSALRWEWSAPPSKFKRSGSAGFRSPAGESSTSSEPSLRLLRIAAFLVDSLLFAGVLLIPGTAVSYAILWAEGPIRRVSVVWWSILIIFVLAILLRDGLKGGSPGKRMMALSVLTPAGVGCTYGRSFLRNLFLIVPGWNLIEVLLVLFEPRGRRTGDRLARTTIIEE
ncbi:MAG: RDD family protein [Thermoanaerobaculia bacterium]